jgi:CTP synthase (UTP-ammonia lyase)
VLKLMDADTAENMTDTENPVITPIACALPNRPEGTPKMFGGDPVKVVAGTRLWEIMGQEELIGDYFCNYGMNEEYEALFEAAGMRVSARGTKGEIRAMELEGKRFYLLTLFQPQLASKEEKPHAVVTAFVRECGKFREERSKEVKK